MVAKKAITDPIVGVLILNVDGKILRLFVGEEGITRIAVEQTEPLVTVRVFGPDDEAGAVILVDSTRLFVAGGKLLEEEEEARAVDE